MNINENSTVEHCRRENGLAINVDTFDRYFFILSINQNDLRLTQTSLDQFLNASFERNRMLVWDSSFIFSQQADSIGVESEFFRK